MDQSNSRRKPNWTEAELDALSQGVAENINVLKGKFSFSITNDSKNKLWATITERINAANPSSVSRAVCDVKKKWQDLQSVIKKKEAARRRSINATGGGPPPEDHTKSWEKVIASTFTNTQLEGIEGGEDTSCPLPATESVVIGEMSVDELVHLNEDTVIEKDCTLGACSKSIDEGKSERGRKRRNSNTAENQYFEMEELKLNKLELYRNKKIQILEEMLALQKKATKALEDISLCLKADQSNVLTPVIQFSEY